MQLLVGRTGRVVVQEQAGKSSSPLGGRVESYRSAGSSVTGVAQMSHHCLRGLAAQTAISIAQRQNQSDMVRKLSVWMP